MKYEPKIAARVSHYGSLLYMNWHNYYIVTKQKKYYEVVLEFKVLSSCFMYKMYMILFLNVICHYK